MRRRGTATGGEQGRVVVATRHPDEILLEELPMEVGSEAFHRPGNRVWRSTVTHRARTLPLVGVPGALATRSIQPATSLHRRHLRGAVGAAGL